jgi:hypothetical protein
MCVVKTKKPKKNLLTPVIPAVGYFKRNGFSLIFCSFWKWEEKDGFMGFRCEGLKVICKFLSAK